MFLITQPLARATPPATHLPVVAPRHRTSRASHRGDRPRPTRAPTPPARRRMRVRVTMPKGTTRLTQTAIADRVRAAREMAARRATRASATASKTRLTRTTSGVHPTRTQVATPSPAHRAGATAATRFACRARRASVGAAVAAIRALVKNTWITRPTLPARHSRWCTWPARRARAVRLASRIQYQTTACRNGGSDETVNRECGSCPGRSYGAHSPPTY